MSISHYALQKNIKDRYKTFIPDHHTIFKFLQFVHGTKFPDHDKHINFKKCINAKFIRTVAKEYEYSQATVSDEFRVVMYCTASYSFSEKEATLLL